jgi:hypothetical protein
MITQKKPYSKRFYPFRETNLPFLTPIFVKILTRNQEISRKFDFFLKLP